MVREASLGAVDVPPFELGAFCLAAAAASLVASLAEAVSASPIKSIPMPNFRIDLGDTGRAFLKDILFIPPPSHIVFA
jgi:hypothetical protein